MGYKSTIVTLGAAHALDHSFLAALPPILLLIIQDLGVTLQTMSLIATVAYLLFGAGALIGGPLADKIGEARVLFISLILAGAASFIPFLDSGLQGLTVGLVLMSAATSFYHPTANSLISKAYEKQIGQAMAIHGVGGSIGQVFIPSISVVLAMALGWRFSFAFFGALSILVAVPLLKVRSERARKSPTVSSRLASFRSRELWIVLCYNAFTGLYFRGTELFVPTFLVTDRGFTIQSAALGVSLLMAFGVAGQVLGGAATDRMGGRKALILESVGVTLAFLFFLMGGMYGAIAFLALYGLSLYATQPTTNALTADASPGDVRGLVYGISFFLSFGLGSVSSAMAGYIAAGPGLSWSFVALMLMSILALGVSPLVMGATGSRSPNPSK
ncbi:MAG: MFS transporter [archaeon]